MSEKIHLGYKSIYLEYDSIYLEGGVVPFNFSSNSNNKEFWGRNRKKTEKLNLLFQNRLKTNLDYQDKNNQFFLLMNMPWGLIAYTILTLTNISENI